MAKNKALQQRKPFSFFTQKGHPFLLRLLPRELLLSIAQFLPAASAAAFSLTCRSIYSILGTKYCLEAFAEELEEFRAGKGDVKHQHYEIMALLDRDLHDQYMCHHCMKTHSMPKKRLLLCAKIGTRILARMGEKLEVFHPCNVKWKYHGTQALHKNPIAFQLAMKAPNRSLYQRLVVQAFIAAPWALRSRWSGYSRGGRSDARVIGGSLLHRVQMVAVQTVPGNLIHPIIFQKLPLCTHNFFPFSETDNTVLEHRLCEGIWNDSKQEQLLSCSYCRTEYHVLYKWLKGEHGNQHALFFTRWQDWGSAPLPSDEVWRLLHDRFDPPSFGPDDRIQYKKGSISSTFENGKKFTPEKLVSRRHMKRLMKNASKKKPRADA